jgi:hypothetical protein
MDSISLENPMLSEEFSSETNSTDNEEQSSKSFMLQNLCCNPKYNKKLSIFLKKIHDDSAYATSSVRKSPTASPIFIPSKRVPEELGVNEGFTDSETDDTTISSDSLYEYIDFIPEPTNFRGRRIGLI